MFIFFRRLKKYFNFYHIYYGCVSDQPKKLDTILLNVTGQPKNGQSRRRIIGAAAF